MSDIDEKLSATLQMYNFDEIFLGEAIKKIKAMLQPNESTIYLGDGNILIGSCWNKDKSLIGIQIGEAENGPYEIGRLNPGAEPDNRSCLIRILSTNPKSLQSLIDSLKRSQKLFREESEPKGLNTP